MTFSIAINLMTILFCAGVTIQSVRMMRGINAIKRGDLAQVVGALDQATVQARIVLSEMKGMLTRCPETASTLVRAEEMAEELRLMIDLADASAERLVEARTPAELTTEPL